VEEPSTALGADSPQARRSVRFFALFEACQSKSLDVSLPLVGANVRQFFFDPFQREMGQELPLQLTEYLHRFLQLTAERSSTLRPARQSDVRGVTCVALSRCS
jgi:hypothetical protein